MPSDGFKASKYFISMIEVEEMLERLKKTSTPDEYRAWQTVLGLAEQQGDYRVVEGIGKIDSSIADFIEELNQKGYQTLSSCSGLKKEHPKEAKPPTGYLSFLHDSNAEQIAEVCAQLDFPVIEGEVYLKPAITVTLRGDTDKEMEEKWEKTGLRFAG